MPPYGRPNPIESLLQGVLQGYGLGQQRQQLRYANRRQEQEDLLRRQQLALENARYEAQQRQAQEARELQMRAGEAAPLLEALQQRQGGTARIPGVTGYIYRNDQSGLPQERPEFTTPGGGVQLPQGLGVSGLSFPQVRIPAQRGGLAGVAQQIEGLPRYEDLRFKEETERRRNEAQYEAQQKKLLEDERTNRAVQSANIRAASAAQVAGLRAGSDEDKAYRATYSSAWAQAVKEWPQNPELWHTIASEAAAAATGAFRAPQGAVPSAAGPSGIPKTLPLGLSTRRVADQEARTAGQIKRQKEWGEIQRLDLKRKENRDRARGQFEQALLGIREDDNLIAREGLALREALEGRSLDISEAGVLLRRYEAETTDPAKQAQARSLRERAEALEKQANELRQYFTGDPRKDAQLSGQFEALKKGAEDLFNRAAGLEIGIPPSGGPPSPQPRLPKTPQQIGVQRRGVKPNEQLPPANKMPVEERFLSIRPPSVKVAPVGRPRRELEKKAADYISRKEAKEGKLTEAQKKAVRKLYGLE